MTLESFLKSFCGSACITIKGYCEELHYDYYHEVAWNSRCGQSLLFFCIVRESWWNEIKDKSISYWFSTGSEDYGSELFITLED